MHPTFLDLHYPKPGPSKTLNCRNTRLSNLDGGTQGSVLPFQAIAPQAFCNIPISPLAQALICPARKPSHLEPELYARRLQTLVSSPLPRRKPQDSKPSPLKFHIPSPSSQASRRRTIRTSGVWWPILSCLAYPVTFVVSPWPSVIPALILSACPASRGAPGHRRTVIYSSFCVQRPITVPSRIHLSRNQGYTNVLVIAGEFRDTRVLSLQDTRGLAVFDGAELWHRNC
ncbi:hypothetical protein B0H19DRAFT_1232605 [Mycena capillaripes]|nr:hypothetical protein B0H19DRAFT_1232605 [Mycena capillaripes]